MTSIEIMVGHKLAEQHKTVATAESCTGGSIAARLTSVPGSSKYVKGGVVAYTIEVKEQLLGVPAQIIDKYGVVSEETATAMAQAAKERLHTDCAVATTGIAGPDGGSKDIPVGHIWIAAIDGIRIRTQLQTTDNGRQKNVERAASNAILLLQTLLEEEK